MGCGWEGFDTREREGRREGGWRGLQKLLKGGDTDLVREVFDAPRERYILIGKISSDSFTTIPEYMNNNKKV